MSTYAAKSDIRRDTCNDVSEVAKTADLAGLKSEVDKTDAGKLETVPFNLRKLSNLVKKMLKILHMINWLKKLILLIQTNKTLKKIDVDKKIPDITKLINKNEFKCKNSRTFEKPCN